MTEKADKKQLLAALAELIRPAPLDADKAAYYMARTLAFAIRKVHAAASHEDPIRVFALAIDERTERGKPGK